MSGRRTSLWYGDPGGVFVKSILICVKAFERFRVDRGGAVHGGILLMAEDYAGAGDAVARSLLALSAHGALLVALELALAASEAI